MAVRVVKEYDATSERVFVTLDRKVDFPTDGKPTRAMRASPDFDTSNPAPGPAPEPGPGSRSWARRRASLLTRVSGGGGNHDTFRSLTLLASQDDVLGRISKLAVV